MIPLKEAINIFEQRKIDRYRLDTWKDYACFGEGRVLGLDVISIPYMRYSLLSYIKKQYLDNNEVIVIKGELQLYGKYPGVSRYGETYNELTYNKIYRVQFPIDSLNDTKEEVKNLDFFENYDYESIYNPSTNYTVMRDRLSNNIIYTDISVDNEEFKEFLDKIFGTE